MDKLRFEDFEPIGQVYVDSGQVMLVDPCYVLGNENDYAQEVYQDVLDAYNPDYDAREVVVEPWGTGLGLVVSTLYGDGGYTVYARRDEHGCNAQILIDFDAGFEFEIEEDFEEEDQD